MKSGLHSVVPLAFALSTLLGVSGCSFLGGGGEPRLAAEDGSVQLPTTSAYSAYFFRDSNSADMYFTDLAPEDRLLLDGDRQGVAGQFLHIHVFLDPEAGQTPLAPTACNVAVRHLVIAGDQIGFYGGGGFMPLSGTPGDESLGGNVQAATIRLLGATPAFDDRLGNCEFSGSVSAPLDEAAAKELARQFEAIVRMVPGVK